METTQETVIAEYDETDIYINDKEFQKEQGEESVFWDEENGCFDEEAYDKNIESFGDVFRFAFEEFADAFGAKLMDLMEPDSRTPNAKEHNRKLPVFVEGRKLGWRNQSGERWMEFSGDTPMEVAQDFMRKVLPQTDMTIKVIDTSKDGIDSIRLIVSHHDSPTGEFYDVTSFASLYEDEVGDRIDNMDGDSAKVLLKKLFLDQYVNEYEDVILDEWMVE